MTGQPRRGDPGLAARKAELRRTALARREALGTDQVAARSDAIQTRLLGLEEFRRARLVHVYVGAKASEVRTGKILDAMLVAGRRLAVPRVAGDRLAHHEIRSIGELRASAFGLLEPEPIAPAVDPAEIDLVVVPGLAFDRSGNRLGFGKGYYDRFLSEIRAVKAALLYQLQLVERLPADERDVPMDLLVTEDAVLRVARPIADHGG